MTDVTTEMVITKEETFGPVSPLCRFKREADAVKLANDTPTAPPGTPALAGGHPGAPRSRGREGRGVAAYSYSSGIGRTWRVAEALEYGIVGICPHKRRIPVTSPPGRSAEEIFKL